MVNTSSLSLDGLFLESSNLSSPTKHIQKLYPECKKIYGPYLRKDGRLIIVLYDGIKRTTKQASRVIMEVRLGRVLDPSETVDHIDRNPLNNKIENLQVLHRSSHASLDVVRVRVEEVKCLYCDSVFTPSVEQRNTKNKAGPFCSRKCSGLYGSDVQNKKIQKMERSPISKHYYQRDK